MNRVRNYIVALSLVMGMAVLPECASAQFLVPGPGGSLGISNGNGSYTYIYPERLNPSANAAQPGTTQGTPFGSIWLGQDGQVHGNLVDPTSGDVHLKSRTSQGRPTFANPTHQRPMYHQTPGRSGNAHQPWRR